MEVPFRVERNTKAFNTICTQNIRVIEDKVQCQYIVFLDRKITFILPELAVMRLAVQKFLQTVSI
jgi:hypothetical protein